MQSILHISIARNLWTRAIGLLNRRGLADDEALLIVPCPSIHTWFMRFSIDVVFLDKAGMVTHVAEKIGPWRFVYGKRAYSCLELSAGTARRLDFRVGQKFSSLAGSLTVDKLQLDLS